MVFGQSKRPLPPGESNPNNHPTISQEQSLASLSELNGLLESALRLSGDDAFSMLAGTGTSTNNTAPVSATATYPPPATHADDSDSVSSSWRLDTTRKLTAVSIICFCKDEQCISLFANNSRICNAPQTNIRTRNK